MIHKTFLATIISAAAVATTFAAEPPASMSWLPSDPLAITLDGTHSYNLWLNLASAGNSQRTYINPSFPSFPFPYTVPGNPGYGSFPGTGNWPGPIYSQFQSADVLSGDRAGLIKVSNGTGGGPFPSGSSMYYGGASPTPNTDGGTLGVKGNTISGAQTLAFQISMGEAYGYSFYDSNGDGVGELPTLSLYDVNGAFLTTLQAEYSGIIKQVYNGSLEMPPGSGVDEDVYINVYGLQWDLSTISDYASYQINFTGVQHAQLYSLRLDQSTAAYTEFIFDLSTQWTGLGVDKAWSNPANWAGNEVPSSVSKAILSTGNQLLVSQNTSINQLLINSDQNFTISNANGAELSVDLNITTEANPAASGLVTHTISAPLKFTTTTTLNVGEDTSLVISGPITGTAFYKRGDGSLSLTGNNNFTGTELVFGGGTTYISGVNTGTSGAKLNIKNSRVVLHCGDERFGAGFSVKLAGTSTPGQTAYLVLGDEEGEITQTFTGIDATQPQYDATLNPLAPEHPPVYIVGGNENISTLIISNGGDYAGFLGGSGQYENNLSLIKRGAGTQTLKGISTYVGDTIIEGGILRVDREDALSANSNLILRGGLLGLGSYQYNSSTGPVTETFDTFDRELGTGAGQVQFHGDGGFAALGGNRSVNFGGAGATVTWGQGGFVGDANKLILASDSATKLTFLNGIDFGALQRTIEVSANSTGELAGVLSGTGGLRKTGNGRLLATAANTYTGQTRIEQGVVQVTSLRNGGQTSSIGASSSAAANLVLAGGTLSYVGTENATTDRLFTLSGTSDNAIAADGTGAVHFTNTGAVAFDSTTARTLVLRGMSTAANRFDLQITNNGSLVTSLTKSGDGAMAGVGGLWIIGNENNTYTGKTFINGGVLEVTKLANGGQASSIGASTNAAGNLAFFRAGLRYTGDGDSTDRLLSVSAYGAAYAANRIESSGTGALKFTNTGAIGLTTGASGTTAAIGTGGHLTLGGTNTDDNTFASAIGGSSATNSRLTKDGTGKWILTGANSYKGVTEILGGVLSVSSLANGGVNSNIGSSTNLAANLILNGGALQYTGATQSTDRRFTVGSSGATFDASGTGALTYASTADVTYASANVARTITLRGTNTGNNTMAAKVTNAGTGAVTVVKEDAGKWVLTGDNTYTGGTQVKAGVLQVAHNNALGTGSADVSNTGTLLINSGVTVNNAVTVSDSGVLLLNGVASNVTFNGGTLEGSGTLDQAITVGSGAGQLATLSPGNCLGTMTFGNAQTWSDGGTYVWEVKDVDLGAGTGWDTVVITGSLTISIDDEPFVIDITSLTLADTAGQVADFNGNVNYSWTILTASAGIVGFDAGQFDLRTTNFANGHAGVFELTQVDNSLVLNYSAVPEPGTWALLIAAGCVVFFLRRRRVS